MTADDYSYKIKSFFNVHQCLRPSDYAFHDIYLLTAAAEDEEGVDEGTIFAGGVNEAGEITGHPALEKAYDMGKSIR